jgi:hypothetical protein
MEAKAQISVVRQSSDDVGYRQIFVTLDGEDFAVLRHGGGATREIEAGPHVLKVHNTLFRRQVEFELQVGEHARFVVVNRAGFGTHFLTGILGAGPVYLTVERESVSV